MPPLPDLAIPLATFLPESFGPYLTLMLVGFGIGFAGHLTANRWLVGVGVVLVFLATFLFPLALNLTTEGPPLPGELTR